MFDFKFDWQPEMATGIAEVDEQHKQLLSMGRDIEQLLQIECIGTTDEQLLDIVCGFRDFTAYHFYTEEVLMEQSGYEKLSRHRLEHQEMIKAVSDFDVVALKKNPVKSLGHARDILQTKIFEHMLVADQDFAKYYKSHNDTKKVPEAAKDKTGSLSAAEEKYGKKLFGLDMTDCYLAVDQTCRGHVILVNKEVKHHYLQLSSLERSALSDDVSKASSILKKVLSPDAFDYACYEDVDERLMYHIVPKYRSDEAYGRPFSPGARGKLQKTDYDMLAEKLTAAFKKT